MTMPGTISRSSKSGDSFGCAAPPTPAASSQPRERRQKDPDEKWWQIWHGKFPLELEEDECEVRQPRQSSAREMASDADCLRRLEHFFRAQRGPYLNLCVRDPGTRISEPMSLPRSNDDGIAWTSFYGAAA
jgi:hypothetical protein